MDAEAAAVQVGGQAARALGDLAVGQAAVPPHDALPVGQGLDEHVEGLGQVELDGLAVWGTASHCTGRPACTDGLSAGRAAAIGKDHGVDVRNPATGEVITKSRGADRGRDRRRHRSGPPPPSSTWRAVAPGDRARLLRRFAAAVDAHGEELAALEVANAGHVIGNARWEAGNVRDVLEFYAGAPERQSGRQIPVPGGLDVTFYEPLGVVGIIVPWNFPMAIAGWGFAPALAAGNTVVLKPAELTPLSALRIGELALEAGLPEGVLQILPGKGSVVGERFVAHPAVRKVCFTGSTEVGRARHGAGAPSRSSGSPSSSAARAPTSSSPTPTSSWRPPGPPTACSTTRARTAAPARASLVRAQRLRALHGAARTGGRRRGGG